MTRKVSWRWAGGEITLALPADTDTSSTLSVAAAVDGMRQLPSDFQELPAEDMGSLASLAKKCGLGDEFMECVMQHRAGVGAAAGLNDTVAEPEPD